jgi:MOSC domain-containing protein YiiM
VQEDNAISGMGLEGDRSCAKGNMRQVLLVDKETLDEFELKPGQIKENITTTGVDMSQTEPGQLFFIGDTITMEIVGECEPCGKMNALQPGLLDKINHRRGMLALVINGGSFKVGDSIRLEP